MMSCHIVYIIEAGWNQCIVDGIRRGWGYVDSASHQSRAECRR